MFYIIFIVYAQSRLLFKLNIILIFSVTIVLNFCYYKKGCKKYLKTYIFLHIFSYFLIADSPDVY